VPFALATFNVKNLLEPREPRDEAARTFLQEKLDAIAALVRACDADVIGLQEVGPIDLARALVARLPGCRYGEPVLGTPDARGIRCAVLTRLPVVYARVRTAEALPFPAFRRGDPAPFGARIPLRRGVVQVRVDVPGASAVDILVVHFKSAHPVPLRDDMGADLEPMNARDRAEGMLRSVVWRGAEALHARGLVDELLAADPDAQVALVGDLNDGPASPVVRALRSEGEGELFDCAAGIETSERFSVFYRNVPGQIDHVLATANLYARLVEARFLNAELRDHGPFDPTGEEDPSVDSDHAPLVVRFG
jgi:endonuclease/exonuclease/phosphatase family metal-dependent hydrolase